jgi:hypothetical protein
MVWCEGSRFQKPKYHKDDSDDNKKEHQSDDPTADLASSPFLLVTFEPAGPTLSVNIESVERGGLRHRFESEACGRCKSELCGTYVCFSGGLDEPVEVD